MALWGSKKGPPPKNKQTPPARSASRGNSDQDLSAKFAIMEECCSFHVPAVLISPDTNTIFQARFASVADGIISFDVLQDEGTVLKSLSTCCVSYFREGRAYLFLSVVQGYRHLQSTDRPRLDLSHPTEITATDVRRAFRVPVLAEVGLEVGVVTGEGKKYHPRPGDISFGGMMVAFPEAGVPDLQVGQTLQVEISLGRDSVQFSAEVRQRMGVHKHKFGLFFPECYRGNAFEPPQAYRRIVMGTEKAWLKHRNR